jgi:uncharacterized protein
MGSFLFVGLIADTHGLMRPEALDALYRKLISSSMPAISASPSSWMAYGNLAPVRAIRGNNDRDPWAFSLPTHDTVKIGSHTLNVLHDLTEARPRSNGFRFQRDRVGPFP